jgi:peptidoglycan/xylan/chitin deacetylase (PgdA/CDA1 family)
VLNTLLRTLFAAVSPAGGAGRLSTLIFHRVHAVPDPLFPDELDAARFDRICGWLAEWFRVLPLDEAATRLRDGTLPSRALAISFDDGYADNHDQALPILRRHRLNAAFFVATGFLDGGCMWNDRIIETIRTTARSELDLTGADTARIGRLALATLAQRRAAIDRILSAVKYLAPPQRDDAVSAIARAAGIDDKVPTLMMRPEQVREMHRQGMCIGAHTVNHPILARLDADAAFAEIVGSRRALHSLLGEAPRLFAYPNGRPAEDYKAETVSLVERAGFDAAFTTAWGAARLETPRLEIPRFTPWDRGRTRFALRLARYARVHPPPLAGHGVAAPA